MSAKTKIVVLRMKELIYTGIFAVLGIVLIILLISLFTSKDDDTVTENSPTETPATDSIPTASDALYIPGIYTTELVLGGESVDVEVIVNQESITSIRMVNLNDAVTTMYPLLQPTLESICSQVYETQSLEDVTYTVDSKYTSLVLLEAIRSSLDKAAMEHQAFEAE